MLVGEDEPFVREGVVQVLREGGFVVEEVDVGEAFALEEAEDAFGFGGEVGEGTAGQASSGTQTPGGAGGWRGCCEGGAGEEGAECGGAEGAGGGAEERAAGREILKVMERIHG